MTREAAIVAAKPSYGAPVTIGESAHVLLDSLRSGLGRPDCASPNETCARTTQAALELVSLFQLPGREFLAGQLDVLRSVAAPRGNRALPAYRPAAGQMRPSRSA